MDLTLAEKARPQGWDEFQGQDKAVATLKSWLAARSLPHIIFTGSPGSGKTTLAQIIRNYVTAAAPGVNALSSGSEMASRWINGHAADFSTKEVRQWIEQARQEKRATGQRTYIFIDEVHRLSRTQQDLLLEPLEKYDFTLVAATTEPPGSYLSPAIMSRVRVLRLSPHSQETVEKILSTAVSQTFPGFSLERLLTDDVQKHLVEHANGDLRQALSRLELLLKSFQLNQKQIEFDEYQNLIGDSSVRALSSIDQAASLSAFIKSIRGSDPESALLWMAQMLEAGVDPRVIARRMVIAASEDVGNAEPRALPMAVAAAQAADFVGAAEIPIILSQTVVFLATAPKSNSAYVAIKRAQEIYEQKGPFKVPLHLTALGGREYENPHSLEHGFSKQNYRPLNLDKSISILNLGTRGFEKKMKEYWDWIRGVGANKPS